MKNLFIPAFIAVTMLANANEIKLSNVLLNTTLSGDARINYYYTDNQITDKENDDIRTRVRLNFSTKVNDFATINGRIRLTSDYELGSSDEGTVINGSNTTASLFTDILYFDYKKGNNEILAGRFSPFYKINDFFVTDGERDGIGYVTKIGTTDLRAGYLFASNETDTEIMDKKNLLYAQAVYNLASTTNTLKLELTGIATSQTEQEKSSTIEDSKGILVGADFTQNLNSAVEFIQIRGQYIQTDDDGENKGNSIGVLFGSKNIAKLGDWKAEVEYKSAGANNSLAKSANQENLKIWAQTYVSPKMNLELEYNNRETLKGAKTVDYSAMSVSLNHSF